MTLACLHAVAQVDSAPSRQERLALALGMVQVGAERLRRWLWGLLKAMAVGLWRGATGGRLDSGLAALPTLWRRLLASALGEAALRLVARCRSALCSALTASLASGSFSLQLSLLFGAVRWTPLPLLLLLYL